MDAISGCYEEYKILKKKYKPRHLDASIVSIKLNIPNHFSNWGF
jgi:hypothetical protein